MNWFRAKYPHTLIFAIPNGEKRTISVATRLKAEGVTRGIPDLYIPACNLWVEMKKGHGRQTFPDQKKVIEYLRSVGHTVIVGKGRRRCVEASAGVFEKMTIEVAPAIASDLTYIDSLQRKNAEQLAFYPKASF